MRQGFFLTGIALAVCLGTVATVQARSVSDSRWPVAQFVSEKSILAKYYQEFANRNPAESVAAQMHMFCDLLLSSDLLADRLSQLGGKPAEMHAILMELGSLEFDRPSKFSTEERRHIRGLMLGLDMQLESIDHSLSTGTRNEFRREVLADIPPLNRVG